MAGETSRSKPLDTLAGLISPGADGTELSAILTSATSGVSTPETRKLSDLIFPGVSATTFATTMTEITAGTPNNAGRRLSDLISPGASSTALAAILQGGGGAPAVNELVAVTGQSNAGVQGVSGAPTGWTDTPRVQMWNNSTSVFETYSPSTATAWGPEVGFALGWLADHLAGTLYIVKSYLGGSQLGDLATYGDLGGAAKDWSQTGTLFPEATSRITSAKASCGLPLTYVIWAQGEADAQNSSATAAYSANAAILYSHIRSDWGDANTKIIAHMVSNRFGGYNFEGMLAQQRTIVNSSSLNFLVDTRGFSYYTDNIHLVADGALEFGRAAYFKATTTQIWFDKNAIMDLDFANSRFFYRNLVYGSTAALSAAGYYNVSANGDWIPVTRLLTSQFSISVSGMNPNVSSSTAQYAVCIDDGNDGAPTDEFVAVARSGTTTKTWSEVVFHTSTASIPGGLAQVSVGAESLTPFKTAARVRTNDMNLGSAGTAGTTATSAPVATGLTNLVLKNRTDGTRPFAGTLDRLQILDYMLDDATLASVTA